MEKVSAKQLQEHLHIIGGLGDAPFQERLVETLRYYDNMSGEVFKAPTLGNATNGFLADELGEIRSEIKPRQTLEKLLSGLLKTRKEQFTPTAEEPELVAKGEKYYVAFKWVSKLIMDGDKIKEYYADPEAFKAKLGRDMVFEDLMKPSEYWECRTYPVE